MILIFIPLPLSTSQTAAKIGPYDLNKVNALYTNYNFIKNSSVSLQGFIYLEKLQKTGITTVCSSTDAAKPDCNTGRYSVCTCVTNCSNCLHEGYIPIININNNCILEVLGAPDSSRQGKASVQLTITTQSSGDLYNSSGQRQNPDNYPVVSSPIASSNVSNSRKYVETFVLPPILFQKWVMITISRDARRFDIYYNDTLVLSKYTSANLSDKSSLDKINIGDPNVNGSAGYFTLYDTIQSSINISTQYNAFVNTRGSPIFGNTTQLVGKDTPTLGLTNNSLDRVQPIFGLSTVPSLSLCSSGDCIQSPTNPPASPYYEWTSSYA